MKRIIEEHYRLSRLYRIEVFRASFLDFLVSEKDMSISQPEKFTKHIEFDSAVMGKLKEGDYFMQFQFLSNIGLIKADNGKITITDKGIEFVEKGFFWDRMKTLATEVRNFKIQFFTLVISIIAAGSALATLILKIVDN